MSREETRRLFIQKAQDSFAEKGYHATTMNDIAKAAGKGRRTLYNYFGTKSDIYLAVIQSELDQLYLEMKEFVSQDIPATEKLMQYIIMRQKSIAEVVDRNGTLRAEFFNDIDKVERARVRFDVRERRLIMKMLDEGMKDGSFRQLDVKRTAILFHYCLKGTEVPFMRGQLGRDRDSIMMSYRIVRTIILDGISDNDEETRG